MAPTPVSAHDLSQKHKRVVNFSAGPSKLPDTVLQRAQEEMLNFRETGSSVMEAVPIAVKRLNREAAAGQFAAVPIESGGSREPQVGLIVTGGWSESAAQRGPESTASVRKCDTRPSRTLLDSSAARTAKRNGGPELSENAAYVYMCDNETVDGVEFKVSAKDSASRHVVSNIDERRLTSQYGLVLTLVLQKNLWTCLVSPWLFVREDLMDGRGLAVLSQCAQLPCNRRNDSLLQHAANLRIYGHWPGDCSGVRGSGGVARYAWKLFPCEKSRPFSYNFDFKFSGCDKSCRSRMNIVFAKISWRRISGEAFAEEAAKAGPDQSGRSPVDLAVSGPRCYNAADYCGHPDSGQLHARLDQNEVASQIDLA
uniref:Protein Wnt n=1 Tax=Macrostomum lignano TaxID=282301 RepID=A0A1I8FAI1_9PLAT